MAPPQGAAQRREPPAWGSGASAGTTPLRYLAVSTMIDTDVWHYPDSGKYGVIGGRAPGALATDATFPARFAPLGGGVDYWDGE